MQDLVFGKEYPIQPTEELKIHAGDRLDIMIYAAEPALAIPFNVMFGSFRVESEDGELTTSVPSTENLGYLVDNEGNIELPFLGTLHVADLTVDAIKEMVQNQLKTRGYISEPIVTVSLMNFSVIVLGEMSPGILEAEDGRLNILQAIAKSGDLQTAANRGEITVIRTEGGVRKAYALNMYSVELFNSPVFNLQQDDIIYVKPRRSKLDTDDELMLRLLSVLLSTISAIASICWWIFR